MLRYFDTMAPSTAMWDTSEYIAAAYSFGLPHPPGNPFFVLIAHVFSILPIGGSPGMRINILAAVCSAVSALGAHGEEARVRTIPAQYLR